MIASPENTLAVIVAVEVYAIDEASLDGPVPDARRFADWLLARGVPARNITVLAAPLETNSHLLDGLGELGVTVTDATAQRVWERLIIGLPTQHSDLLLVHWGGHGVVDERDQRQLIYPDARTQAPRAFNLTSFIEALRTSTYANHPRQQIIVDACWAFTREPRRMGWLAGLATERFPSGALVARDQTVLFAASAGEYALNSDARKTGLFSEAVLSVLNSLPDETWPPDMTVVRDDVNARFVALRAEGATQQVPSHIWYKARSGEEESLVFTADLRSRTPATVALPDYLRFAAEAADDRPYLGPMSAVISLSQVYVARHAWAADDSGGESPLEGATSAESLIDRDEDVLLVGAPGAGKSALARAIVRALTARRLDGAPVPVPVMVTASELTARPNWRESLALAVTRRLQQIGCDGEWPANFFAGPPAPGSHWIVLVDGLDEVVKPHDRRELLSRLARAREDDPEAHTYRFLLTTRPLPPNEFIGARYWRPTRYNLMSLNGDQVHQLVEAWMVALGRERPDKATSDFLTRMKGARLTDLARNPLLLTMLCHMSIGDGTDALPDARHRIYERFVDEVLRDRYYDPSEIHRPIDSIQQIIPGELARNAAGALATDAFSHIERLALARHDGDDRPMVAIVSEFTEAMVPLDVRPYWGRIVGEVLRRSGLMVVQGDDFEFIHQTVADYLVAKAIAADPDRLPGYVIGVENAFDAALNTEGPVLTSVGQFVLARTHADPAVAKRLAKQSGSLNGACLIATLVSDNVGIDTATVERARRTLSKRLDRQLSLRSSRVLAGRGLADLGDQRGVESLLAVATDRRIDRVDRIRAARFLDELNDGLGSAALLAMAEDISLAGFDRVWAARVLSEQADPRGCTALRALAADSSLQSSERVAAARFLAELGDDDGIGALSMLTVDGELTTFDQIYAAHELTDLNASAGRDALYALSRAPFGRYLDWVLAARVLMDMGDDRGRQRMSEIAEDLDISDEARDRARQHLRGPAPARPEGLEYNYLSMRRAFRQATESSLRTGMSARTAPPNADSPFLSSARTRGVAALIVAIASPVPVLLGIAASSFTYLHRDTDMTAAPQIAAAVVLVAVTGAILVPLGIVGFDLTDSEVEDEGPSTIGCGAAILVVLTGIAAVVLGFVAPGALGPIGWCGDVLADFLARVADYLVPALGLIATGTAAAVGLPRYRRHRDQKLFALTDAHFDESDRESDADRVPFVPTDTVAASFRGRWIGRVQQFQPDRVVGITIRVWADSVLVTVIDKNGRHRYRATAMDTYVEAVFFDCITADGAHDGLVILRMRSDGTLWYHWSTPTGSSRAGILVGRSRFRLF
ncbi:NACHT domain-containing protein [Nocardia xishanensis]|uniref:NACHT domain-containing protein n=1 Tax=Nocardia xishanensis TaxID=238964 RepID=A0ABW7XAD2_9NOCA